MNITYKWVFKLVCKTKLSTMAYDDILALQDDIIRESNIGISQYDSEQLNILLKLCDKELSKRGKRK